MTFDYWKDQKILILKTREVESPRRWTLQSSWIDFFIPTDLTINDVKFTPLSDPISTKSITKDKKLYIAPGEGLMIPTGIKMIIKDGFDLVFDNKSWIAVKKWLVIWAKVIDSDYRWEVHIHLINTSNYIKSVKLWDKVAQAILRKVYNDDPKIINQDQFDKFLDTERGEGWFWSTWS